MSSFCTSHQRLVLGFTNFTYYLYSCGVRIQLLQTPDGGDFTEEEACIMAGSEYENCAPCNPNTCNDLPPPTVTCGCETCTDEVLDRDAGGLTCRTRIDFLQGPDGGNTPELDACRSVANQFPETCGPCSPCR